jgi:hypothetical protein
MLIRIHIPARNIWRHPKPEEETIISPQKIAGIPAENDLKSLVRSTEEFKKTESHSRNPESFSAVGLRCFLGAIVSASQIQSAEGART